MIETRPWGCFYLLQKGEDWWLKLLKINPHGSIDNCSHKYRDERLVIVYGIGTVIVEEDGEEEIVDLEEGDSIYIPKRCKHQVTNLDKDERLLITEIAFGICEEEDIISHEDTCNRI